MASAALPPENYGAETPKPIDRFDEADVALVRIVGTRMVTW